MVRGKRYREILDPNMSEYRTRLFNDLSRVTVRYGVLDARDKVYVVNLIKHKIQEGEL